MKEMGTMLAMKWTAQTKTKIAIGTCHKCHHCFAFVECCLDVTPQKIGLRYVYGRCYNCACQYCCLKDIAALATFIFTNHAL